MKPILLLTIFVFLLASCGNNLKKSIDASYADGTPAKISYLEEKNGVTDTVKKEEFYDNGKKKVEGSLKNNKRDGTWTYWHKNGKVWSQGTFKDGLSHGTFNIFHEDGSKYMQSCYKNGKPDGVWTFFDKNVKKKEVYFKNDSIIKQIDF